METWAVVTLVLGTNIVSALLTFFITKMQVSHSDERLEKQLARAREETQQKRRWEVRSEPLLKLRDEIAQMATKLDKLVASAQRTHTRIGGTDEEAKNELQESVNNWNTYLASGNLTHTLFMRYDVELVNLVEEIRKDYQQAYFSNVYFRDSNAEDMKKALDVFGRNKDKIIKIQELVNKNLEEL